MKNSRGDVHAVGGAVRYCGFGSSAEQVLLLLQIDAARLRQALAKQLFHRIVAVNELVLVHVDGLALIVRIIEVHNLDEQARQEAVSYHCYRALVTPDTVIELTEEGERSLFPQHTNFQLRDSCHEHAQQSMPPVRICSVTGTCKS